ncbi:DUF6507 family protein [Microbacterium sp. 179-I 3D4 NHS]|uniref:DUF6507 family protein n=1 Tax=Microbacterium sp. 179-I 3D4 NHS TaxID=3142381 RepID=UPI0039A2FD06
MSDYRVDPDGVLGVLAGLDDIGADFGTAAVDVDTAADDGATALAIDDRTVMSRAWKSFMNERRSVPGKIMHTINVCSQAVSEATLAVVAGDDQMATATVSAQAQTGSPWGIAPSHAYMPALAG